MLQDNRPDLSRLVLRPALVLGPMLVMGPVLLLVLGSVLFQSQRTAIRPLMWIVWARALCLSSVVWIGTTPRPVVGPVAVAPG